MAGQNKNFICMCAICGGRSDFLSRITMQAGYGSSYDGEQVTIPVCGDCFDIHYTRLKGVLPEWVEITEII